MTMISISMLERIMFLYALIMINEYIVGRAAGYSD